MQTTRRLILILLFNLLPSVALAHKEKVHLKMSRDAAESSPKVRAFLDDKFDMADMA
jgi:hypothetical protein